MNFEFATSAIKIKSNWFDSEAKVSKMGVEAFVFYLQLYRYFIPRQQKTVFALSIKQMNKDTGLPKPEIMNNLKLLEKQEIIQTNVHRWNSLDSGALVMVEALDVPETHREVNGSQEIDKPVSGDDFYTVLDTKMIQLYLDLGVNPSCIAIYALLNKFNNNINQSIELSMNDISNRLGVSRTRVRNSIQEMNRERLMYSAYRENNRMVNGNNDNSRSKFEHFIFRRYRQLEQNRLMFKNQIDSNLKRWNKEEKI